jgi:hypothetical protein
MKIPFVCCSKKKKRNRERVEMACLQAQAHPRHGQRGITRPNRAGGGNGGRWSQRVDLFSFVLTLFNQYLRNEHGKTFF